MCRRITQRVSQADLRSTFGVVRGFESIVDWEPRYNVAPTMQMICVRDSDSGREVFPARWGLVPGWTCKNPPASTFNACSDTVAVNPMFRSAFTKRRCLVIASGFYEWRKIDAKTKQPYYITLISGAPMPIAALWEAYIGPNEEPVQSCTMVTHTENDMMAPLHDRMPVILTDALIDPWLDRLITAAAELQPLLGHYPPDEMQAWPVSKAIENVKNQGPELIRPIEI